MINLAVKLPKDIYVACSGGVDSMAAVDFLKRKHNVTVAFFNHGTDTSHTAQEFLNQYCKDNNIVFLVEKIKTFKSKVQSTEEHWRTERYKFLDQLDLPVVTAHHLDDAVETWVWSSMHGTPKLPKLIRGKVYRPFLTTPKTELIKWCNKNNVPWVDDKSNNDTRFMRNYIRHEMMPHVLTVNPGIDKIIKKKLFAV